MSVDFISCHKQQPSCNFGIRDKVLPNLITRQIKSINSPTGRKNEILYFVSQPDILNTDLISVVTVVTEVLFLLRLSPTEIFFISTSTSALTALLVSTFGLDSHHPSSSSSSLIITHLLSSTDNWVHSEDKRKWYFLLGLWYSTISVGTSLV